MPAIDEQGLLVASAGPRMAIISPYIHRKQLRHFLLFNVLPLLGTIAAAVLMFFHPVTRLDLALFFMMWLSTGLGISVGFHRLLCHRSFKTARFVQIVLIILGSMTAQGPVVSWVAMHRRHHQMADKPGDLHSPNLGGGGWRGKLRGFLHSHLTWMLKHEYPNVVHYVPDLLKDRTMLYLSRHYLWWVLLGLLIPTLIAAVVTKTWIGTASGFLWGGAMRLFVVGHSIATLNSVLHLIGRQRFRLRVNDQDNSRNSWLLAALVWGEGWHNNHHAFPYSASFGLEWYRLDFGFWLIKCLQFMGLASNVKVPSAQHISKRHAEGAVDIPLV